MRHRLYLLGELTAPSPAPAGAARIATAADLDLLLAWFVDFSEEVGDPVINAQRAVVDRLDYGGLTLWEVDGTPVSMAGITRLLEGDGIRIGPVYTPKPLRGRGYAAAATAAACRTAFDRGAREVSLFTDLANPTSNALYQRLGFRPLGDRLVIHFEPH
jgi:predicted GNAT family acetyltransferase